MRRLRKVSASQSTSFTFVPEQSGFKDEREKKKKKKGLVISLMEDFLHPLAHSHSLSIGNKGEKGRTMYMRA